MSTVKPESDDPLQAELAALRPTGLTPQVVSRIAGAVESDRIPPTRPAVGRSRARWIIGALATGLAAGIAVTAFVRQAKHERRVEIATTEPGGRPVGPPLASPVPPITLGEYRHALARSPEAALALLDRGTPTSALAPAAESSPRAFGHLTMAGAHGEADTP